MTLYRTATLEDLPAAYQYVDNFFGPGITPYEDVLKMQEKNDLFINIVTDAPSPVQLADIFGYFCLVPLNEVAHEKIKTSIFYGKDMRAEDMPEKGEQPSAIYIGAIASRTHQLRTLRAMFKTIAAHSAPEGTPVYARPVSEDGIRLIEDGRGGFHQFWEKPDDKGYQMFVRP